MKKLNDKKLGTAPDNPRMGNINDITASTQEKKGVIRNNSGNSTERSTKMSKPIQYFFQLCQHKIYFTQTLLFAQLQIQRECPLFIRGCSKWTFFYLIDGAIQKQTI